MLNSDFVSAIPKPQSWGSVTGTITFGNGDYTITPTLGLGSGPTFVPGLELGSGTPIQPGLQLGGAVVLPPGLRLGGERL
jgi:hypothetical protein